MRIISRTTLIDYAQVHSDAAASITHWLQVAKGADWSTSSDVQAAFSKARVLNAERVRFEISGGDYRLIVAFDYGRKVAFIKFIGTHAEYDRIDALTVSSF